MESKFFSFILLFMGLIVLISLYWYWQRRHIIRFSKKYQYYSIRVFLTMLFKKNTRKDILQLSNDYIEVHKLYSVFTWIGLNGYLLTADPNLIEKVLLSQDVMKKGTQYKVVKRILGNGLVTLEDLRWRDHRRNLNPVFKHKNIQSFFPIFHRAMKTLSSKFEILANDGCDHGVHEYVRNAFVNVSLETVFDKNLKDNDKEDAELLNKLRSAFEIGLDQIIFSFLHLDWILILVAKFFDTKRTIQAFIKNTLRDRLTLSPTSSTANSNIFLNQILKLYKQREFSFDDIVNESKTILFAAFETTSDAMFACLCMLAMHPEVQDKLFEELKDVFPDKDVKIEHSDMDKMPYLDRVINETLRLYPPIPILSRHAVKDMHLSSDLVLPKGLQVIFSLYHLHRRTDFWGPNAHKFDPDNFLPENVMSRHPYSFMPFLKGSRNCIGRNYALNGLKISIAGVIRNYRFETTAKQNELQEYMVISLHFKNLPKFKIYRRD